MVPRLPARLLATVLLWTVVVGCGGDDGAGPADVVEPPPVVGLWHARGVDADLGGDVDVLLDIQAGTRSASSFGGALRVTVTPAEGGQLTFPGTWQLTGERLRLRGTWFADGEVDVRAEATAERLILHADDGTSQVWVRRG